MTREARDSEHPFRPLHAPHEPAVCPKCDAAPATTAEACPRCGLTRERWTEFAGHLDAEAPPELRAEWEACESNWDDEATHDRFVDRAARLGAFSEAARRYRLALRSRPGDPTARARSERLRRMAEAVVTASALRHSRTQEVEPYRRVVLFLIVLLLLAAAGGVVMMIFTGS